MPSATTLLDVNDGIALRTYYESLRGQLENDRSTWDPQWRQLAAFFDPYGPSWDYSDTNQGERRDYSIINETGLLAKRTLQAGALNGMSPPSGKWFKVGLADNALNMVKSVRVWCDAAEAEARKCLLRSNAYESLLDLYGDESLYGTSVMLVLEDKKTKVRCYPFQMGRYYLSQDNTRRIDLAMRILYMTVRQIVDQFGFDNCSSSIQTMYTSNAGGNKETRQPVIQVIHKGNYFKPNPGKKAWPWVSVYYEMGSFNEKRGLLSNGGFEEDALIVGRWSVKGENVYGTGCATDCLGSVMSLQAWEERTAQATEKQFNPPMIAGSSLDPRSLTVLPGGINFADEKDVSGAFVPAMKVDFKIEGAITQIQRIESRINDAMYRSLFQTFLDSDRREITAEEIRARAQEKMQVIGPVVERNVEDVLAPLVRRVLQILVRIPGALRPMPPEMRGKLIKLEFESILAQAQKIRSLTNLTQYMNIVTQEAAVDQGILDNVDMDEYAREAADLSDVPAKIVRSEEEVAQVRADKQRAQQQAMMAENAQKLAQAAQTASETQTGTGSLLDRVIPSLAGGQA